VVWFKRGSKGSVLIQCCRKRRIAHPIAQNIAATNETLKVRRFTERTVAGIAAPALNAALTEVPKSLAGLVLAS
jgi:hypothetical protein